MTPIVGTVDLVNVFMLYSIHYRPRAHAHTNTHEYEIHLHSEMHSQDMHTLSILETTALK